MKSPQQDIERAIAKLRSFCEAGSGIIEVVACGQSAIPALRAVLFEREGSGLFDSRCRAVDALAALNAYDVLFEYLDTRQTAGDSVERLGDDAVINYTAWSLARTRDERVFALLLRLAKNPSLSGVIGALGTFGRSEAIPLLVDALAEDGSRNIAEFMLGRFGRVARPALIEAARSATPPGETEGESSRRLRRSCLSLLAKIGLNTTDWPTLRPLMSDDDPKVVVLVSKLCVLYAAPEERREAIDRLVVLLSSADWMLRHDINGILSAAVDPSDPRPRPEDPDVLRAR